LMRHHMEQSAPRWSANMQTWYYKVPASLYELLPTKMPHKGYALSWKWDHTLSCHARFFVKWQRQKENFDTQLLVYSSELVLIFQDWVNESKARHSAHRVANGGPWYMHPGWAYWIQKGCAQILSEVSDRLGFLVGNFCMRTGTLG
jgi:hypothetical protein